MRPICSVRSPASCKTGVQANSRRPTTAFQNHHPIRSKIGNTGLGAEEEAFEYAALMNKGCDGKPCKPILLDEAQSADLVVLVTPNTFVISDALAMVRDGHDG